MVTLPDANKGEYGLWTSVVLGTEPVFAIT